MSESIHPRRAPARAVVIGVCTVLAVSVFATFRNLDREEYSTDEGMWMYIAQKTWPLFRSGAWDDPSWENIDATWGYVNPPIAKYLLGWALSVQGVEWTWRRDVQPPAPELRAARRPSAVLGVVGSLGLLWIGWQAFGRNAAILAALLLTVSPLWLEVSRRAMTDVYGATLGLLAVCAFLPALAELDGRRRIRTLVPWIAASGALAGLAVGAKLNAAPTPAFLGAALLFLLLRVPFAARPAPLRDASVLAGLGILFAAAAVVAFVGPNPYLHEDAWNRFQGIVAFWKDMCLNRAARAAEGGFGVAFYPEQDGARILLGKFVAPLRPTAIALILPLLAGAAAGRLPVRSGRRLSPVTGRLIAWLLLIPATLVIAFRQNPIVHPWLPWIAFLGAITTATSLGRREIDAGLRRGASMLVPIWLAVVVYFVWRMTFLPQTRYYLPLLPIYCVVAGWGLAALRDDLGRGGRRWPRWCADAAIAAGVLAVIATLPEHDSAVARSLLSEAPALPRLLHGVSVVAMTAAVAGGLLPGRAIEGEVSARGPSAT